MQRPVATVNGVPIYSDKRMSGVINNRIMFHDGSYYDGATGHVHNNGPGYISVGAPEPGAAEGRKTPSTRTERYAASGLRMSDLAAHVSVVVHDAPDLSLTITGDAKSVEAIGAAVRNGTLVVHGGSDSPGINIRGNGISIMSTGIGGSIVNIGSSIGISTGSAASGTTVTIGIPRGTPVDAGGVIEQLVIGDTEGPLKLRTTGGVRAGRVATSSITVMGHDDVDIAAVNGDLSMDVMGSGSITVRDGSVRNLNAKIMGSGDITFDGTATDAVLTVMGSGDIKVRNVVNKPRRSVMGSGDIDIGNR